MHLCISLLMGTCALTPIHLDEGPALSRVFSGRNSHYCIKNWEINQPSPTKCTILSVHKCGGEGWEKSLLDPWIIASFLHSSGPAVLTKLIKILDSWWNLGSCSPFPHLVRWKISSEKERWVGRRGKKGGAGDLFQREQFFRNTCMLDSMDVFNLESFVKNMTTLSCPTKKKVQSQRVRHDLATEQQQQLLTVPRIWTYWKDKINKVKEEAEDWLHIWEPLPFLSSAC